jgi:transcription termination factor NusB
VEITKDFIPDETYKFINNILDKIGMLYEKQKTKNNQ